MDGADGTQAGAGLVVEEHRLVVLEIHSLQ
jgi:hypothetical protein